MSADAFAAALARGAVERPAWLRSVYVGLTFGVIEGILPIVGWAIGFFAAQFIEAVDHWIAFALLAGVGSHMILESFHQADDTESGPKALSFWALVATAIGTSIDAAAVGVSLALLEVNIYFIALCIGLTTFAMATTGLLAGRYIGSQVGSIVGRMAGFALIGLGTKILLEHLGYLA